MWEAAGMLRTLMKLKEVCVCPLRRAADKHLTYVQNFYYESYVIKLLLLFFSLVVGFIVNQKFILSLF